MEKWMERGKKIVFIPPFLIVLLVIVSVVLLIYSLGFKGANPVVAYISYVLSAYTLTVVVVRVPPIIKGIQKKLHNNKYSAKYLTEPVLRAKISLYLNSSFNILYALFYLGAGILYHSVWTGAIAVYYIVLSFIRIGLVRKDRKALQIKDKGEQRKFELKSSFFCGCFMFALNVAVTVMTVQMIWQNKHYDYPGLLIYAQAAYTFYCLCSAIIKFMKYRKMERPILTASKIMSIACALTSILALQTAMITQFGNGNMTFARLMNSFTGAAVCFNVFAMAVWLIHKTRKELKENEQR